MCDAHEKIAGFKSRSSVHSGMQFALNCSNKMKSFAVRKFHYPNNEWREKFGTEFNITYAIRYLTILFWNDLGHTEYLHIYEQRMLIYSQQTGNNSRRNFALLCNDYCRFNLRALGQIFLSVESLLLFRKLHWIRLEQLYDNDIMWVHWHRYMRIFCASSVGKVNFLHS